MHATEEATIKMTTPVRLRVEGLDFANEETNEQLALLGVQVGWNEVDGIVLMTVFADDDNPVTEALEAARLLHASVPSARVTRVYEELVSTSDVAYRVGVSREAARKWSMEDDFPIPFASVGGGERNSSKIWAWADIVRWLYSSRAIDMDEKFPSARAIAEINAGLAEVPQATVTRWYTVTTRQPDRFATTSAIKRTAVECAPEAPIFVGASASFREGRVRVAN